MNLEKKEQKPREYIQKWTLSTLHKEGGRM